MAAATRVGIVGAGSVGATLGRLLQSGRNVQVKYGTCVQLPGQLGATLCSSPWVGPPVLAAPLQHQLPAPLPGSRDPSSDKMKALLASQPGAAAESIPDTVEWADVVILATPSWDASKEGGREQIRGMAASLGPGIRGKVLIDVINGLTPWPALSLTCAGRPGAAWACKEGREACADLPCAHGALTSACL